MEFEWDPETEQATLQKQAVDFTEAATVFGNPLELTISDPDHATGEYRSLSMATQYALAYLLSYTERENRIRIISARTASPKGTETV